MAELQTIARREKALGAFYENLAHTQRDQDYYLNPVGVMRREAVVKLLRPGPRELIGDLGCGDGLIALKLQGDGRRIIGCDCSPTRVERARANGIDAVAADVTRLPFPDGFFDKAVCSEVLEHLREPAVGLCEIHRVLRDGGVAVLTVPLGECLDHTLLDVPRAALASMPYRKLKKRYHLESDHLTSFSAESFKDLLRECGFALEECAFTDGYVVRHPRLLRRVRRAYYAVAGDRPAARLSRLAEALARPLVFLSHGRQDRRRHIVVRARKPGH